MRRLPCPVRCRRLRCTCKDLIQFVDQNVFGVFLVVRRVQIVYEPVLVFLEKIEHFHVGSLSFSHGFSHVVDYFFLERFAGVIMVMACFCTSNSMFRNDPPYSPSSVHETSSSELMDTFLTLWNDMY